jgi:O-antigen/teichoic acid export membrane protein
VKSVVTYGVFGVANSLIIFLTNILLVRTLTQSSYGEINVALSYLGLVIPLITFNALGLVSIKRSVLDNHEFGIFNIAYKRIILLGTIVGFVLSLIIVVYFNLFIYFIFVIPVYICFVAITDYSSAILIQDNKPATYGIALMISRGIGVASAYTLIYYGCDGLFSYFLGLTIGEGVSIIYRINAGQSFLFSYSLCSSIDLRTTSKEIIVYGVTLLPLLFFGWFLNGLDKIVISENTNLSSVAVYSFAMTLAQSFSVINSAIINVKTPEIYRSLANKTPQNVKYGRFLIIFLTLGVVLLPFFYLTVDFVIQKLINPQYEESAGIATILMGSVMFNGAYRLVISVTDFYKKNLHKTLLTILSSSFSFLLMTVFIERFGSVSVALSILAGNIALFIGALILANNFTKGNQCKDSS